LRSLRIIGPGRAGTALASALAQAGWDVAPPVFHGDDPTHAARDVDIVLIATPDAVVADVARAIEPSEHAVVAHVAGSLGLDALAPHDRRASVHPLVSLPSADIGARRLRGAWFAVAGDPIAHEVVAALDGHAVVVDDEHRALYHAAAAIASNHLVALLGQVDRVAASAGVPLEAYLDLVRGTVDNVELLGPRAALTGPVARGDDATIARHLAALPPDERPAYEAMVAAARRLLT
jgi:predicted short-subunit dehydrogenase-like oxidoreductase (DUF2520 family)